MKRFFYEEEFDKREIYSYKEMIDHKKDVDNAYIIEKRMAELNNNIDLIRYYIIISYYFKKDLELEDRYNYIRGLIYSSQYINDNDFDNIMEIFNPEEYEDFFEKSVFEVKTYSDSSDEEFFRNYIADRNNMIESLDKSVVEKIDKKFIQNKMDFIEIVEASYFVEDEKGNLIMKTKKEKEERLPEKREIKGTINKKQVKAMDSSGKEKKIEKKEVATAVKTKKVEKKEDLKDRVFKNAALASKKVHDLISYVKEIASKKNSELYEDFEDDFDDETEEEINEPVSLSTDEVTANAIAAYCNAELDIFERIELLENYFPLFIRSMFNEKNIQDKESPEYQNVLQGMVDYHRYIMNKIQLYIDFSIRKMKRESKNLSLTI